MNKSSAIAQVAPELSKALSIISNTTFRKTAVDLPENMLEMRKETSFLRVINELIIYKLFKDFTNKEVVVSRIPLTHFYTQSPQRISSKNLENKIPSDIFRRVQLECIERSSSHFFRTTSGIESRRDAFEKSRLVVTFLTSLEVEHFIMSISD